MKDKQKYEDAKKLVEEFQTLFKTLFNTTPVVLYELDNDNLPVLVLTELESLVNKVYKTYFPDIYTVEGVRSKTRLFNTVMFRYIFYSAARQMGYPLTVIAKYLGFNHATVLHGIRAVENLIETNEPRLVKYYNIVRYEIQTAVVNNGNVHDVEQSWNNS